MYVIALLRYRKNFDQVAPHVEAHRAYLRTLKEKGTLLASGPLEPRSGGALLLRVPDHQDTKVIDAIRDADPFVQLGLAQYEMLPWNPVIGQDGLDKL